MKKLIIPVLLLALLLSGCALDQQAAQVKDKYIDPALDEAKNGVASTPAPEYDLLYNVLTDRDEFTAYEAAPNVGSRKTAAYMSELAVSSAYGRLLPYVGAYLTDDAGAVTGYMWGLVTMTGQVVLDPVLCGVSSSVYTTPGGAQVIQEIYILSRRDGEGALSMAVCATDGSWCSDFEFEKVLPMELGVLCIRDEQKNDAVIYGEDGGVIFDTRINSTHVPRLEAGTIADAANCGSSLMPVRLANSGGMVGFMDTRGVVMNLGTDRTSYFYEALPFSEGLAAVRLENTWGYLAADGDMAIRRQYEEAGSFRNGKAVVKAGGVYSVIDTSGEVLKEFPGASEVYSGAGWIYADGTYYSAATLEPVKVAGAAGSIFDGGFYVKDGYGVRALTTDGTETYLSGAGEIVSARSGAYIVRLRDGSSAVMNKNGQVIAAAAELCAMQDAATGETYACAVDADACRLYNSAGTLVSEGFLYTDAPAYPPVSGYSLCAEGSSVGWKDPDGEWIFRLKLPTAD